MEKFFFSLILALLATAVAFTKPSRSVQRPPSYLRSTLTPDDLIRLTKEYLADPSPDKLADDYVFRGPIVGPLVKKVKFLTTTCAQALVLVMSSTNFMFTLRIADF